MRVGCKGKKIPINPIIKDVELKTQKVHMNERKVPFRYGLIYTPKRASFGFCLGLHKEEKVYFSSVSYLTYSSSPGFVVVSSM